MSWGAGTWLGMGGGGTIVNDGILAELSTMQVDVELQDSPVVAEIANSPFTVELSTPVIEVEICE